jgi:hypothetical protein
LAEVKVYDQNHDQADKDCPDRVQSNSATAIHR